MSLTGSTFWHDFGSTSETILLPDLVAVERERTRKNVDSMAAVLSTVDWKSRRRF